MAKSTGILTPIKLDLSKSNPVFNYIDIFDGLVCTLDNNSSIFVFSNLNSESDYHLQMFNILKEMYSEYIITIDMNNLSMFNQSNQDELMCYWLTSDCENTTFDILLFEVESFEFFHYDLYNLWGEALKRPLISTAPHQFIPIEYGFSNWNMLVKPEWLAETGILDNEDIESLNNNKSIIWFNH